MSYLGLYVLSARICSDWAASAAVSDSLVFDLSLQKYYQRARVFCQPLLHALSHDDGDFSLTTRKQLYKECFLAHLYLAKIVFRTDQFTAQFRTSMGFFLT